MQRNSFVGEFDLQAISSASVHSDPVVVTRRIPLRAADAKARPLRLKSTKDPILKEWISTEHNVEVVGIQHRKHDAVSAIKGAASRGEVEISLRREPKNRHDRNAIAVFCEGRHVGYVPAETAEEWAPRMDADPASVSFALDLLWLNQSDYVKIVLDLLERQAALWEQIKAKPLPLKLSSFADLVLLAGAARADGRMSAVEKEAFLSYAAPRVAEWNMPFERAEAESQLTKLKKLDDAAILEKLSTVAKMEQARKQAFMSALEAMVSADGKVTEAETRFLSVARIGLRMEDASSPGRSSAPPEDESAE